MFSAAIRFLLGDLLAGEQSWDSKARWLEGFGISSSRIWYHETDRSVRLADAMVWVLREDPCGGQWAAPFRAEIQFAAEIGDLAAYTIQFGDRREFPGEDFQSSLARIERELEDGRIEWAFVFRHALAVV
jgi:hypothetical protein